MYQPFYCKTCHVDCNSSVMLEAHLSGKSHKKKLKQLGIEDNADMEMSKGKILTLEQKLVQERYGEPVIGLDQIIVIKPRPNFGRSYEPKYRCVLCDVTAEIDPIYQHLVGHRHRSTFLEILLKKPVDSMTKEAIKRFAEKWDDKNPKQMRYIESNSRYEAVMPSTQVDKERLEGKGMEIYLFLLDIFFVQKIYIGIPFQYSSNMFQEFPCPRRLKLVWKIFYWIV